MGLALAQGWRRCGLPADALHIVDPHPSDRLLALVADGCTLHAHTPTTLSARLIVLAVKPQTMPVVMPALKPLVQKETLVLSIAAGLSLSTLEHGLGTTPRLIRAMPNLPASIGAAITAAYTHHPLTPEERGLIDTILQAVGAVVWLEDEAHMAAVTALSGSGPAYVFHLLECLIAAGTGLGLTPHTARTLAIETVLGSAKLAAQPGADPSQLRAHVTSPQGTTAAGLAVLMAPPHNLMSLITKTVDAATTRAHQLDAREPAAQAASPEK